MESSDNNQRRIDDLDALVTGTKRLTTRYKRTNYSLTRGSSGSGSTASGSAEKGCAYILHVGGRKTGNTGANAGKLFRSLWQMPYAVILLDAELNILDVEGDRNTAPQQTAVLEIIDQMIRESAGQ